MTVLGDILDESELSELVASGFIRAQVHPSLPLRILKYTDKCVYENVWTPETTICRGLIVNTESNEVIARPLKKFWSLGQHETLGTSETIPWHEPFDLYEKVDGSCGVLHPVPGGHAIATLGSFTSDQAIHATEVWNRKYEGSCTVDDGLTYIFEIVFPENRIVVPYGFDDLVLLGAVNIRSGHSLTLNTAKALLSWTGLAAKVFDSATYWDMADNEDEEGYVLHFSRSDFRLKAKFATYLRLHRLMTMTSSKTIWAALRDGRENELAELPDELHPFATQMVDSLKRDYALIYNEARHLCWLVEGIGARKQQADFVLSHATGKTVAGVTFALLDGKDPSANIWKAIEPEFVAPFENIEGDDDV